MPGRTAWLYRALVVQLPSARLARALLMRTRPPNKRGPTIAAPQQRRPRPPRQGPERHGWLWSFLDAGQTSSDLNAPCGQRRDSTAPSTTMLACMSGISDAPHPLVRLDRRPLSFKIGILAIA